MELLRAALSYYMFRNANSSLEVLRDVGIRNAVDACVWKFYHVFCMMTV